ncbi:hypothetical protein HDU98_004041 [Podochytrium sp. JEL0797]|nr:hypothetical protein HDU98_004041 [Podochytrium sp. JEL0797]
MDEHATHGYLDPRLNKEAWKQNTQRDPTAGAVKKCASCGQKTLRRCSQCKALAVCDPVCFKKIWKSHKVDCLALVAAAKRFEDAKLEKQHKHATPVELDMRSLEALQERYMAVFARHDGITAAPEKGSTIPVDRIVAFFVDMLKTHDAGNEDNKALPLPIKICLNRRYNNAYVHLANNFHRSHPVFLKVHHEMRTQRIGDSFRV